MKTHTCKYFIVLLLSFFTFILASNPLHAQSVSPSPTSVKVVPTGAPPQAGINLTIPPIFFNLTTNPGQITTPQQLKVKNNNSFTEYLRLDLAKFIPSPNATQPVIQDLEPGDDFANWISFDTNEFSLAPGQIKTIKFTINPPKSAALGYYYAILINRIKEREPGRRETAVKGSAAVSILLDVRSPNAKRQLQLVDFSTDKLFYEYLPVTFTVKLKNAGNIHSIPVGDIFVDWGGAKELTSGQRCCSQTIVYAHDSQ